MADKILYPFGDAEVIAPASAAVYSVDITNRLSLLNLSPTVAGALNLVADDQLPVGSVVYATVTQGATGRNITIGVAGDTITAPALTGMANDVDTIELVWTGTKWQAKTAAWQKIIDAA